MPWSQQRIIAQDKLSKEESFFFSIIFMIYLCLFLSIELSFFLSFNIFVYFLLIFEMWVFFFPSSVWTLLACVSRNPKLSRNIYGPQLRWSVWFITLLSFIYLCFSVLLWNLSRSMNVNSFLYHMIFLGATVCIDLCTAIDFLFSVCM
jgi:hypothetical protein